MIRFYCNSCGKSLRADETVIGRKSKCSGCRAIVLVPDQSTRAAGEKIRPLDDAKAVLAERDPFDDMDMLISEPFEPLRKVPRPQATAHQPETPMAIPIAKPTTSADDAPKFTPSFRRAAPRKKLTPILMTVIFVAALSVLGCLTYWLGSDSSDFRSTSEIKTEFEKTAPVLLYDTELARLKASQQVLEITSNGYLTAKGLPKSSLKDLDELRERVELATHDGYAIVQGNALYAAGKLSDAKILVETETDKIAGLRKELDAQVKALKEKTYSK